VSYNTSKSAVLQMARSMACELGPKGIRVNTLSPGHIYTSYVFTSCSRDLIRKKGGASHIGVNEPDCAEWRRSGLGRSRESGRTFMKVDC
jgi:NAD(P)-dependent dehydrogenase (short-subunit alcohol dehydrogenase family)